MKRIKHRDLTHYFLEDHRRLPRAYVASCERFFKSFKLQAARNSDRAPRFKYQTSSSTDQGPSVKLQAPSALKGTQLNNIIKIERRNTNG